MAFISSDGALNYCKLQLRVKQNKWGSGELFPIRWVLIRLKVPPKIYFALLGINFRARYEWQDWVAQAL